jgi:hypothetical protein
MARKSKGTRNVTAKTQPEVAKTTPPPEKKSLAGRVIKKTRKAQDDEEVAKIEPPPRPLKVVEKRTKSLEKIRRLNISTKAEDEFARMKEWTQKLSPTVCPLNILYMLYLTLYRRDNDYIIQL